jgi:hypothetical protein
MLGMNYVLVCGRDQKYLAEYDFCAKRLLPPKNPSGMLHSNFFYAQAMLSRLQIILIISATLLPFALTPAAQYFPNQILALAMVAMGILGPTHVPATLYLLSIPEIRERRQLLIGTGLFFVIGSPLLMLAVFYAPIPLLMLLAAAYTAWGHWHYGRQNFGICMLASGAEQERLTSRQQTLLNLAAVCGMLGCLKSGATNGYGFGDFLPIQNVKLVWDILFYGAALAYALVITASLPELRQFKKFGTRMLYFFSIIFFVPLFLFPTNPVLGLGIYGTAHGMQYLALLGSHALRQDSFKKIALYSAVFVVACIIGFHIYFGFGTTIDFLFRAFNSKETVTHQFGAARFIALGTAIHFLFTSAHFVFDAQIWSGRKAINRGFLSRFFQPPPGKNIQQDSPAAAE